MSAVFTLVRKLVEAKKEIGNAISYNNYSLELEIHDFDSSEDAKFRIEYVKEAERLFVLKHKKDILALAVDLVDAEINMINVFTACSLEEAE